MLKELIELYTVSNEDADEKLDEAAVEETEVTDQEETDSDEAEEKGDAEDEDSTDVEAEETNGDTTVLDAPTSEQGEITVVDDEETVTSIEPSDDVMEAGDDIGQAVPDKSFDGVTDQSDITAGSDEDGPAVGDDNAVSVNAVVADGVAVAEGQAEIIKTAEAAANGDVADSDVNGNAITPEEVDENEKLEEISEEVDTEAEEEIEVTNVVAEETPEEEAEALSEEIQETAEESVNENLDGVGDDSSGDDSSDTGDTSTLGSDSSDDSSFDDDDVPLEGTEEVTPSEEGESTEENQTEDEDADTRVTEGDTTDVEESVADQNLAADVTAEAASSDVNDTDAIKGLDVEMDDKEIPLDIDVDDSFKDKEVDGNPAGSPDHQDDTAATVEETIDDPSDIDVEEGDDEPLIGAIDEEEGTDANDAVDADAEMEQSQSEIEPEQTEQEEESTDESVDDESNPEVDATDGIDDVEQTSQIGDDGEIEDVDENTEFEEGDVDLPAVDTDTTDDEVAKAEVAADDEEVAADKDEEEAVDASKTVEELQNESTALESLIERLKEGVATENYSTSLIVQAYVKLDQHRTLWNANSTSVPSLEDYGPEDLDLVYKASLESARGFLSRTTALITRLNDNLSKWWNRPLVTKNVTRATALNKAVDKCVVDLKASTFKDGEVTGVSGYLATDKDGLVRAIAEDLKYTTTIATKGLVADEKAIGDLVKALDDVATAKTPADINKVVTASKGIKSAKGTYPSEAFVKGALMGNWKLVMPEEGAKIPKAVKEKSGDRKTTFKLTKSELGSILVMAKAYAALAKKTAETAGARAVEGVPAIHRARERALPVNGSTRAVGKDVDEKQVDELASELVSTHKAHHNIYKFVVQHALDMADALIAVVNKAK